MNLYLKRSAYALLILALIVAAYVLIKPNDNKPTNENVQDAVGLEVGSIAPDISLMDMDGNQMKLSDLKGKKVFLNFWATWCPPCREEMPDIEKMKEKYGNDLTIIAVSSAESKDTVAAFLQEYSYTFSIYLDEDSSISRTYQLSAIPTSYFIDEDGIIQQKSVGAIDFESMEAYYKDL